MNNKIINAVEKIKSYGVTEIEVLVLASETSYEVVFYGLCKGQMLQSNVMAEDDLIPADAVECFYESAAEAVRADSKFDKDKMNIVKYHKTGCIEFAYDEKNCKLYSIKKEWKKSI